LNIQCVPNIVLVTILRISVDDTVTCIARQQTDKHLATEYTDETIELRMLFLVARQQSARQAASEVTIM
jgi:hypothetical protein